MLTKILKFEAKIRSLPVDKKLYSILPFVIFLLLILWFFRKILITPGIVGHTWDWGILNFPQQFLDKTWSDFFIWDQAIGARGYFLMRDELLYWILILPFSVLGGATVSKLIPILFLFIAASSAYKLGRPMFDLNPFWSTIDGIFICGSSPKHTIKRRNS
ncbi:hypothetical protein M1545_00775 [Patescibacteria group bacterium]|nr:hypothetical protein [Patescibacteria group bacterium]MCL5985054.1 hypothetical protein [Actinomycetota bacterium]